MTAFGFNRKRDLIIGIVLGVLGFGLIRFAALPEPHVVHYHANWAIFLEGSRLDLTDQRYMEDIARCKADPAMVEPEDRVHMHEHNQDVVHVHHAGAAWGHLMANLGMALGDTYIILDDGREFRNGERGTLKFILNGQHVASIQNQVIRSEDRLLISYGSEGVEALLREQFSDVEADAREYNHRSDPASCSGSHGEPLLDKLKRAYWF